MRLLSSCPWHCQTDSHHCQTDSSQLISGYGSQKAKPYLPLSLSLSLSAGHNPSPGSSPNETPLSLTSSMGQADPILTISLLLSLVVIWTHSTLTYPSSELHVKHGGPHPSTAHPQDVSPSLPDCSALLCQACQLSCISALDLAQPKLSLMIRQRLHIERVQVRRIAPTNTRGNY